MEEGVINDQFFTVFGRQPGISDVPELNMQIRFTRLRRNGYYVFQMYPTGAYWVFRGPHAPPPSPEDDYPF